MAFDPVDNYTLMFGGQAATGDTNGSWVFSGGSWSKLHPETSPPPTSDASLAFDPALGALLLFDSRNSVNAAYWGQTWSFAGGVWTNLTSTQGPQPSLAGWTAMVYDAAEGYMMLVGESAPRGESGVAWEYSAGSWHNITAAFTVPDSPQYLLAWDPEADAVVLLASYVLNAPVYYPNGPSCNSSWEFRSGQWVQFPELGPCLEPYSDALTYDAAAQEMVLFSGLDENICFGPPCNSTWILGGSSWIATQPSPHPILTLGPPAMAYDPPDAQVLLYGGFGTTYLKGIGLPSTETWAYSHGAWHQLFVSTPGPDWGLIVGLVLSAVGIVAFAAWLVLRWRKGARLEPPPPGVNGD